MISKKHLFSAVILTVIMVLALSAGAYAVNANSDPFPFTQPNGTIIAVRLFGDEFLHWEEDSNGNLIVFDYDLNGYCAGVWTDEGAVSTGELVGPGLSTVMFKPASQGQYIPQAVWDKAAAYREELTEGLFDEEAFVQAMATALAAEPGTPPEYASVESMKRKMLMIHVTFEDRGNILTRGGQEMPKMSGSQIYDLCFGLRENVDRSVNGYYQDMLMTDEVVITPAEVLVPMDGCQGVIEVVMPGRHPHWGSNDSPSIVFMREAMIKVCAENLIELSHFDTNGDGTLQTAELAIGMIIDGFEYSMGNIIPNFWGVSVGSGSTPAANLSHGVKIASLFAQGAFHRNSGDVYDDAGTPGVIVHEMGHSGYSFQDTYDTGGLSARSGGLGYWSMQASGDNGRLAGEYAGATSGYQCAYNLVRSGFVIPGKAAYGEKVVMDNHLDIYLVQTPIVTPVENTPVTNAFGVQYRGQYFLLQQRKWDGKFNYDRGALYYIDASSNESTGGMLIQHVDLNVPTNRISNKPGHYRAGYEEAHGGTQHMQGTSGPVERRGDLGDLWGVTKHEFSYRSDPISGIYAYEDGRVWVNALTPRPTQDTPSGITLTNIQWDPATFTTSFILQAPTYENLYLAVQGETNAAAAYRAFAAQAQKEGYPAIATLFTATADAETKHAEDEWAILVSMGATDRPVAETPTVGTTLQNLAAALAGETYEYTEMYPAFVAQAQEDELADAERIFRRAQGAEEVHAGNFADVLALLSAGEINAIKIKYSVVYRCPVCGEVVTTLPESRCPICGANPEEFIEYVPYYNYQVWMNTANNLLDMGETLYVDIMLKGDINYTMAETKVAYDTDLLEYAGYENMNGWMGQIYKENPNLITTRNIPAINMNAGEPCLEDVKLVTLKFIVKDTLVEPRIESALSFDTANVYGKPEVLVPLVGPEYDLTVVLFGPAFVKGLYKNMELYPDWIVDGDTQPIFNYVDAVCEIVYVEVPCDTDRDGLRDRVSIYIMRPQAKEGFRFPVLLEHSSYHNGTVMYSAVSGSAFDDYPEMREPFRYKHNWPIHKELDNPAFADTTHLSYDDIKYKGVESYEWPWIDEPFETGSWYTGTEYGNVPAATASARDAKGNIIYEPAPGFNFGNDMFTTHPAYGGNMSAQVPTYYRYYMPRGYALVLGQLLGNRDSDGVTSTLHTEEVLSAMAVINWLNGDAKGYTTRRGNVEVKADWANGNVAMAGRSYPADIAFATVVSGVPGLKAVMPQCNGLNWYDYYRYAGTVNYPGGYGGEDLNNHASINFTRWRADLPPGASTSNYFPDPNGQWFPKSVQDVFFETQNHMKETTNPLNGDYNTEWETRNFGRLVGNINEDVGLLMTTAFMDWNSQPKLSLANWTVLLDKCPGTFREFISISSHTDQQGAVIYGKSIAEWWHSWMDHFLLGLDNGVTEALPDLTVINSKTGNVEGYWIKGNPNAQPGDADYEPVFLERGGIVPGARNHNIYLIPGQEGKAGRLSFDAPAATVEHFNDMNVLDMLQATYPGCPTLTDAQKTINLSSDGNYRATTGNGVGSQSQFCEGRAIGVNRTYDFGVTGTAPADIAAINEQIFAAVDKPIEGRLMYLSGVLEDDVRLSGAGAVYLMVAPDKGMGNLSAAVVEIGRVRNMESSRANAWSMTPGTGNNLLTPAYSLSVGGGTSFTIPVGTFRNPSEDGVFMNYKYVTVGYADVQNPDPAGKTWCEVPEQNYIPNFYFQTTKIVPGQYYPYTIELDPYDYIFHAGCQIGVMIFGTDPDYCELYDECCIPSFDIKIGPESYARLPLIFE